LTVSELLRDRGLVLHTLDHAETDRIVSLLTERRAKLELLAKGARRLERTSGAALDVLNLAEIIYYKRRSGLHLLREASLLHSFPKIRQDLSRLEAGLLLAQWAKDLVPREIPDPRPFRLSLRFLNALEGDGPPETLLCAFKLRLLSILGYRPVLHGCLVCGGKENLTWSPERGGFVCRGCGGSGEEVPPRIQRTMEALLGLPLAALTRLRVPEEDLKAIDAMLTAFREAQVAP